MVSAFGLFFVSLKMSSTRQIDWLGKLTSGNTIGIDGKTVRGARRKDGTQVHLLSAFIHHQGITIAQQEISVKSNEITAAITLLEPLYLKGKIVTADALHTQNDGHSPESGNQPASVGKL